MLIFAATTAVTAVIAPSYIANNDGWITPSFLLISQFLFGFWLLYSSSMWRMLVISLLVILSAFALSNFVMSQGLGIESGQGFAAITGILFLLAARNMGNKIAEQGASSNH